MATPTEYTNWSAGHDRAKLVSLSLASPGVVVFNYNPNKVQFKRAAKTKTHGSGSAGDVYEKSDLPTISVQEVTLEGMDTKPRCDLLMGWTTPPEFAANLGAAAGGSAIKRSVKGGKLAKVGGGLARFAGMLRKSSLPSLYFQWGPPQMGFCYEVFLTDCNISYTRFNELGIPVRATVSLTLKCQPNLLGSLPTNPSSGGIEGRSVHLVREGENLVGIATEHYGQPGRWRALAEANRIADPLRLRPGAVVYLPNPTELAIEGAPR